jgi:DNA-3-methyladenine glycosylase
VSPPTPRAFPRSRLECSAPCAAQALLGAVLLREEAGGAVSAARIVETEAYREDDPASHSYARRTARVEPMFGPPGTAYVYRSYGMHWCLNVTVEPEGIGAAVLLRAARVLGGREAIRGRRPEGTAEVALLRGPGNLTCGLDVDAPRHDGGDLLVGVAGLRLVDDGWRPAQGSVVPGPRVGVRLAPDVPWRFHLGTAEVSAYRRSPRAVPTGRATRGHRPRRSPPPFDASSPGC